MDRADSLSAKQQAFVREYLVDLNATQAAIRAGYSAKTARQVGGENLTKPAIRAAVDAALSARSQRVEVKADDVLRELMRVGLMDPIGAFDENGALLPLHRMPEEARRAISGFDLEELWEGRGDEREQIGTVRKVRFWPKVQALEALGKHLKLFTEVKEHRFAELTDEQLEAKFLAITVKVES